MDYKEYQESLEKKHSAEITRLSKLSARESAINSRLYEKYDVKRGLRDLNGNGVVCGLTEISEINAFKVDKDGNKTPCKGELFYRGVNIYDLVEGLGRRGRFGFEETAYLLLFGTLPTMDELAGFNEMLCDYRPLPPNFVRDIIMKNPSADMMNMLARCVLSLYSYDRRPDRTTPGNTLRQCVQLIARFPLLAVYSQNAYNYYHTDSSLFIHKPDSSLSAAENLLYMLREDKKFTPLEARVLDTCLVLHAEHGGGNNSTFTTHVVTSSGTDTYSSVAASLGSLKGPKHGGANVKVVEMFDYLHGALKDYSDGSIRDCLNAMLNKEAFDKSGLIYGMGHAVYSLSDPRCDIRGIRAAQPRCGNSGRTDCGKAQDIQGRKPQRGLLFGTYLQYAGTGQKAVHAAFRRGAHCGLVGAQDRRTRGRRQDNKARVQGGVRTQKIRADRGQKVICGGCKFSRQLSKNH